MSIAHHLKEIGRGPQGARPLNIEQAQELMALVLDRRVSDLEIGAFALAMRMKGETVDELLGFAAAANERCLPLQSDRPVIVIPSYNGARRLPNLVPLLAMMLAREGIPVLLHGLLDDPGRVTTYAVIEAIGASCAIGPNCASDQASADAAETITQCWRRQHPAFIAIDRLNPALKALLDVRRVVGVRNSGHTIAKLLNPFSSAPTLRLASYTHPEFGALMSQFAQRSSASMMLLRGTEGEAVADPRRQPQMQTWLHGQAVAELGGATQDGVITTLPELPRTIDAPSVAAFIRDVLEGRAPCPAPIKRQVELLVQAWKRLS